MNRLNHFRLPSAGTASGQVNVASRPQDIFSPTPSAPPPVAVPPSQSTDVQSSAPLTDSPVQDQAIKGGLQAAFGGIFGGFAALYHDTVDGFLALGDVFKSKPEMTPEERGTPYVRTPYLQVQKTKSTPYATALKQAARNLAGELSPRQVQSSFQMLESAISDPSVQVIRKKKLGGGINGTFLVTLSNGAQAVFKPTAGEDQSRLRDLLEEDHQGKREQAAYIVDKAMGHLGRVPPTVRRTIEGQEGALMYFVPDSKTAEVSDASAKILQNDKDPGHRRLAILDNVIGNLDRHEGNWMICADGNPIPIDHGISFPWTNGDQGYVNFDFAKTVPLKNDEKQALKSLVDRRDEVTQELSPLLHKQAIEATFNRVERMISEGTTSTWWLGKYQLIEETTTPRAFS